MPSHHSLTYTEETSSSPLFSCHSDVLNGNTSTPSHGKDSVRRDEGELSTWRHALFWRSLSASSMCDVVIPKGSMCHSSVGVISSRITLPNTGEPEYPVDTRVHPGSSQLKPQDGSIAPDSPLPSASAFCLKISTMEWLGWISSGSSAVF